MILHLFTVANLYIMIELLFFYYNYVAYNIHHSLNYMLLISQVLINTISLNKFQQFEDSNSRLRFSFHRICIAVKLMAQRLANFCALCFRPYDDVCFVLLNVTQNDFFISFCNKKMLACLYLI